MGRITKRVIGISLLVLAGGLCALSAVGQLFGNLGWLAYRDQLRNVPVSVTEYPLYRQVDPNSVKASQWWVHQALMLNGDDSSLRWKAGRIALAAGEVEAAIQWLGPLWPEAEFNLMLQLDRLTALSLGGQTEQVLAALQAQPVPEELRPQPVRAAIDGRTADKIQAGDWDSLEQARQLRPADLYVNYRLWQRAQASGNSAKAGTYRLALTRFTREALEPADNRLLLAATAIMPDLRADGLWEREQTRRVAAYLVWQHPTNDGVETLLKTLAARYPDERDWPELLQEQVTRRAAPAPDQANLGTMTDDLADRQFAADQLKVDISKIGLGPELVTNENFEIWSADKPAGWRFYQYLGGDDLGGLYVAGKDRLASNNMAVRIMTLRGGRLSDGSSTFGEYIGTEMTVVNQPYLVTVVYRAQFEQGGLLFYVGEYLRNGGYIMMNQGLPDTSQQWQVARFVLNGPSNSTSVMPVLRDWGIGQIGIAHISMRSIAVQD